MLKSPVRRVGLLLLSILTVAAAGAAAPAQAAAETGSLAGRLTDGGSPAAGVLVTVQGTSARSTITDGNGFFRAEDLQPGSDYRVSFAVGDGAVQYAQSKINEVLANRYTVVAGEETIVNDSLLPRGSVTGRFLDSDGSPVAGASVSLLPAGSFLGPTATTDTDGSWRIDVAFAASYTVLFQKFEQGISQHAFGKPAFDPAHQPDLIDVTANATTTVDDTALARGEVLVRARDSVTGAPIDSFFTEIIPRSGNTETGEALVDLVQAGNRTVKVFADAYHQGTATVAVTSGARAAVTVDMVPVSNLELTTVDAATGAPVAGVCIQLLTLTNGTVDAECDDVTDEHGNLSHSSLTAGTYQLFAAPVGAPGYGAQWVGHSGGTGRQLQAEFITLRPGQTKSRTIKLDRAGTITGRVTKPDGQPAAAAVVGLVQGGFPIRGGAPAATFTDENGHYTIDFAGPYDWPLSFAQDNLQFAGRVANRHLAPSVSVTTGATTIYNYQFKAGTAITATVTGLPEPGQILMVHNAFTGDIMGWSFGDFSAPLRLTAIGPQFVKFHVITVTGTDLWYRGSDFSDAGIFFIPSTGSRSFTLNFS